MKYFKTMLVLSGAGTLFAGYLSGVKLFTGTCALNEPCPYFLGYPACWYGFAMFLSMFIISLTAVIQKSGSRSKAQAITAISAVGTIFAGSFIVGDVRVWLSSGASYALVLPSCVYGLVFYMLIFVLSLRKLRITA